MSVSNLTNGTRNKWATLRAETLRVDDGIVGNLSINGPVTINALLRANNGLIAGGGIDLDGAVTILTGPFNVRGVTTFEAGAGRALNINVPTTINNELNVLADTILSDTSFIGPVDNGDYLQAVLPGDALEWAAGGNLTIRVREIGNQVTMHMNLPQSTIIAGAPAEGVKPNWNMPALLPRLYPAVGIEMAVMFRRSDDPLIDNKVINGIVVIDPTGIIRFEYIPAPAVITDPYLKTGFPADDVIQTFGDLTFSYISGAVAP